MATAAFKDTAANAWAGSTDTAWGVAATPDGGTVTVLAMLEQGYDLEAVYVTGVLDQLYTIAGAEVVQTLVQIYGLRMVVMLLQRYGDAPVVKQTLEQWYGDASQLRAMLEQPYEDAYRLITTLEQPYVLPEFLVRTLEQRYAIAGIELKQVFEQLYDVRGVDIVLAQLQQPFSLLSGESQTLQPTPGDGVIVGPPSDGGQGGTGGGGGTGGTTAPNTALGYYHINIEATRDQYCMSCEVHLTSQADYARFRILDDLVLTVGGETFEFFVESKHRQRGHGTAEYSVRGLSKTALLDAPYAEPISPELSGMASQIIADLAPGYTVNYDTVDQYFPPDTLMPANQTPLSIIRNIAQAVKAVVQTEPDGTLTIEPYRPESVNNWPTCTVQHTLSDAFDFFTTGEDYDHRPGYNRYLVGDGLTEAGSTDRLEEEAIDSITKRIRAYQVPWADDFDMRHTGGDWVSIVAEGIETRLIEDEEVEFIDGSGNTRFPIYGVVSGDWLQEDLGNLSFSEDGKLTAAVAAESLANISYYTKCRLYTATDPSAESVQLVMDGVDGSVVATVVVVFGESVAADQQFCVVELDDAVNVDSAGNVLTSFTPDDQPGFVVHFDPAALRIDRALCSSGSIAGGNRVSRSRTRQMQFTNVSDEQELSHIPSGALDWSWFDEGGGNSPVITINNRKVQASGSEVPAIGTVEYSIGCTAYRLTPPALELEDDATYPVLAVIYMEEA